MKEWTVQDTHRVLAGSAAGVAGTFVGHPLDTIKTRLQTSPEKIRIFWLLKNFLSKLNCICKDMYTIFYMLYYSILYILT